MTTVLLDVVVRDAIVGSSTDGTSFMPLSVFAVARSAGGSLPCAIGTASSAPSLGELDERLVDGHQLLTREDALDAGHLGVLAGHEALAGSMLAPLSAAIAPPAMPSLAA